MNNISLEKLGQTVNAMKQNRELAMKKWTAHIEWKDGVENQVDIRNFQPIVTDEPEILGGTDKGANPVEYLIGAVGSCFAITFEVIASQMGIKLEKVEVDIEADLNAAIFLGLEEGDGGILNPIINLRVAASASEEQIKEIGNIALLKSPVLASLKHSPALKINLIK
ncbi:OsmC family protein [Oceanirhabdus seepicola]|uniref:OsmC family protein n=1 Tax=Oceanirhabdus seepicola TaxID=2828781 RepID=A0A9J6NZW4_9CLOT|nr:OsmC family protein [Oceanirhabdus seepicola]MCM1989486.1 OsmC family protein [Oceanirhabdus seepicola]